MGEETYYRNRDFSLTYWSFSWVGTFLRFLSLRRQFITTSLSFMDKAVRAIVNSLSVPLIHQYSYLYAGLGGNLFIHCRRVAG